jgi:hypothetical protein
MFTKKHSYKVVGNGRYRDAVNSDTFDGLFKTNLLSRELKDVFKIIKMCNILGYII